MSPYRVEKLKISEIKEKVKEFAKEHEIILGEWVDIICVLDKSEINYVVVTAEEMGSDSVFGKYVPEEKTIYILQETYDNARDGDGPSRMTIAHEIGHYVLHKNGVVLENSTGWVKITENSEWQAKVFGGELLAPSEKLENMTDEEISAKYGISTLAAKIQKNRCEKRIIEMGGKK